MIRHMFWNNLTRSIDAKGLQTICDDPKDRSSEKVMRIYVPTAEERMYQYYCRLAAEKPSLHIEVHRIPSKITAEYTKSINEKPGILALAMEEVTLPDGSTDLKGIPFIVPGARFNEVCEWKGDCTSSLKN